MATQIEGIEDLYPLSTAEKGSIPLDVIRVKGLTRIPFQGSAPTSHTLPDNYEMVYFYSGEDCFIFWGTAYTELPDLEDAPGVFVPAQTIITVAPPTGAMQVFAVDDQLVGAVLVVQNLVQFAALAQPRQYTNQS